MIRFLLVFLSVYSLMHALFYLRVRVLLPDRWPYHFLLAAFLALMIFGPVGARLLERADHHVLARISAFAGYSWMGFIFYAFWFFLLLGAAELIFKLANVVAGSSLPTVTGRMAVLGVLAASLAVNIHGYFEAGNLRVERFSIPTAKLPPGVDRVRIAQISDIHLGLLTGAERVEAILAKVKTESPDILVCTGDLVDGDMNRIDNLPAVFATMKPRLGKYAVTGNHEIYAGLAEAIQAERSYGFKVLRGEITNVGNILNVAGVDDPAAGMAVDEKTLLGAAQNGLFTLLLKHRPEVDRDCLGLFDLQLSGHTHYGQIYPFRYIAQRVYPFQNGPYFLEKGTVLYTSRGSGTWGPPIRVLAPPEVTIIDIVRE
ncbi:MAG: metallophosphoesterase [Syntrophobacter sp.]